MVKMTINNNRKYDFILDVLLRYLKLETVYLFGSILTDRFNKNSDIDIAFISDNEINNLELYNIKCELEAGINYDVDLIDFVLAPATLKIQILKNKKIIYCNSDEKRLFYEMKALSEYQKLNDERKIVIESKFGKNAWMLL